MSRVKQASLKNDWEHGRGRLMGAWHDHHANIAFLDAHVERVHWSNPKPYGEDTFDDDDITYYAPYE